MLLWFSYLFDEQMIVDACVGFHHRHVGLKIGFDNRHTEIRVVKHAGAQRAIPGQRRTFGEQFIFGNCQKLALSRKTVQLLLVAELPEVQAVFFKPERRSR